MRSITARHGIPKVVFSERGPNINRINLKKFVNYRTSYTRLPVSSCLRFCSKTYSNHSENSTKMQKRQPILSHVVAELLIWRWKEKLQTLAPSLNVNVNTNKKLWKSTISKSIEFKSLNKSVITRTTTKHWS